MKFIAYLFYKYYSTGATKDIAYFSTLCALVMLIGLHIFQILLLLNRENLLPSYSKHTRVENFLIIAVWLTPVFLLTAFFIRKSELLTVSYSENRVKKGNVWLVIYIVASIAFLILLLLLKKGR